MKLTHYLRAAALIAAIFPLTAAAQTRTIKFAFQKQMEHPQAMGVRQLILVDSEPNRATELKKNLNVLNAARAEANVDVAAALRGAGDLIHATPTGMEKWPGLPIPAALLRRELWVAEVVYFPIETELLTAARAFEPVPGMTPDAVRMEGHFRRLLNARASVA